MSGGLILVLLIIVALFLVIMAKPGPEPTPEGCRLVACHDGEGWGLEVHDRDGKFVAMLAWPEEWPESVDATFLTNAGFEVA